MIEKRYVLTGKFQDRFWNKVDKSDGDCWNWTASKVNGGYGTISVKEKLQLSHRVSWVVHFDEISDGLCVLHKCDNPPCVNPAHLFLGTRGDNNRDRAKKGRNNGGGARGVRNGRSKLTPAKVRAIRRAYPRVTLLTLARKYHVAEGTIGRIVNRKVWIHID